MKLKDFCQIICVCQKKVVPLHRQRKTTKNMLYYKVNKENSNKQFGTKKIKMYYVPNELFTEKECKKYNVDKALCTPVIVSKNKTHWFFGARFINYKAPYHLAIV